VTIAVEPHDSFVRSSTVAPILKQVSHQSLGVIWDIANAFSAGEDPGEGWAVLGQRLAYVQVKDGRGRGDHWQLTALGAGDVPLPAAFELLAAGGYTGALSVEWEYAWHPELDPPEVALPAALRFIKRLRDAQAIPPTT
jgi:sugar phosphate isomerase/epimerase